MISGTQQLQILGPMLWDFAKLWMHFLVNGKKHTFNGLQLGSLSIISSHCMEKILNKNSHGVIAQFHSIQMQPLTVSTTPLALQQILDLYACVFVEPMGFPPSIPNDHHISLLHGCIPPNIRTIPTWVWIDISMDLIERIPTSGGKIVILVVVDHINTYSHFYALSHPYVTFLVA